MYHWPNLIIKRGHAMGWSIGLVVMRGNSCPRGHEFESQHQIQHECFFTLFAVKLKVCPKRQKINEILKRKFHAMTFS